jgi:proteasome-associated ATPase
VALKEEVDRLAKPPSGFGVFLGACEDGTADVFTGGRKMRVSVSPAVELDTLRPGQEVVLNEALNVVIAQGYETIGEVVMLKEVLEGGDRALVISHADEERVARLAEPLRTPPCGRGLAAARAAVRLRVRADPQGRGRGADPRGSARHHLRRDRRPVGPDRADPRRDRAALPARRPVQGAPPRPPKGVLLYGPPGCGKTLIAKAVANSLAKKVAARTAEQEREGKSFFLNIKGPELLNKYVGETERHIRLVFQRAREKASEGMPVIVFFDEMDSIFRTRGSGVSSDVENTIVPQLLSEIDGVEGLENVIVIGASNREDMIDPAILRPGRLDVKIKIERPDARRPGTSSPSTSWRACRCTPTTWPSTAARRGHGGGDDPAGRRADVQRDGGEPLPRGDLRQRRQGGPVLQGLQLRRHDREHRGPGEEDGDQGVPRDRAEGAAHRPPADRLRG